MDNLAKNLIYLRKKHSYTQDQIAGKVFVTRQAVSKWERGESYPDMDTIIALSSLYSITIDDLVKIDLEHSNIQTTIGEIEQTAELKALQKKKTIRKMCLIALYLLGVYSLICGILHTSLALIAPDMWMIWFTLPIIPPLIFGVIFRSEIGIRYLPLFVNIPFISGLLFLIIHTLTNSDGSWVVFLMIPVYYAFAISFALFYKKK